jgi:hypothetical protein
MQRYFCLRLAAPSGEMLPGSRRDTRFRLPDAAVCPLPPCPGIVTWPSQKTLREWHKPNYLSWQPKWSGNAPWSFLEHAKGESRPASTNALAEDERRSALNQDVARTMYFQEQLVSGCTRPVPLRH